MTFANIVLVTIQNGKQVNRNYLKKEKIKIQFRYNDKLS